MRQLPKSRLALPITIVTAALLATIGCGGDGDVGSSKDTRSAAPPNTQTSEDHDSASRKPSVSVDRNAGAKPSDGRTHRVDQNGEQVPPRKERSQVRHNPPTSEPDIGDDEPVEPSRKSPPPSTAKPSDDETRPAAPSASSPSNDDD